MQNALQSINLSNLSYGQLLALLINTKIPKIFAESEIYGNGEDWTLAELSLLGDVNIVMPVTVFDDGRHRSPQVHENPFKGMLMFTPGALLRNDMGFEPVDSKEVIIDGAVSEDRFFNLYERRLLPLFKYASKLSSQRNKKAIITIPGIGCGQFSGSYTGIAEILKRCLIKILDKHSEALTGLSCVYFDPYSKCQHESLQIEGIKFRVRPLMSSKKELSQLCNPKDYNESLGEFDNCDLYSFVAWDHVSWPGNDYFRGSRVTDDGVKSAATDAMFKLTGIEGKYCPKAHCYLPPDEYLNWKEVVSENSLGLVLNGNIKVLQSFRPQARY